MIQKESQTANVTIFYLKSLNPKTLLSDFKLYKHKNMMLFKGERIQES